MVRADARLPLGAEVRRGGEAQAEVDGGPPVSRMASHTEGNAMVGERTQAQARGACDAAQPQSRTHIPQPPVQRTGPRLQRPADSRLPCKGDAPDVAVGGMSLLTGDDESQVAKAHIVDEIETPPVGLARPVSPPSPERGPVGPGDARPTPDHPNQQWFCCVPTAPAQKQCQLMSALLIERGWKEWPAEDWFISSGNEMLQRPADQKHCDFCNCGSYSNIIVDIPGSEHAYDRLMLADIAQDLCPPSYKIKEGKVFDVDKVPGGAKALHSSTWRGERPACWFLKENSRNYGQGIDVTQTAAEALEIARKNEEADPGKGRDYVLQPHILRPLLSEGRKFHIRVYCLIMVSPQLRYPRNLAHADGKLAMSDRSWSPNDFDKKTQITTSRSPVDYMKWEHYESVHPACLAQTAELLKRMESKLGPQPWAGRAAFELLGLDFMVDDNFQPYLLEANTGPVLKAECDMQIMQGMCDMIFGTADKPLHGSAAGTGPACHGWVELNDQRCTAARRQPRIAQLIKWVKVRKTDPECELCLEEELIAFVTDELSAFSESAGMGGPRMLLEAGVCDMIVDVLSDQGLNQDAFVMVLGELLSDYLFVCEYADFDRCEFKVC